MATEAHIDDLKSIRENVKAHMDNSIRSRNKLSDDLQESSYYYLFQGEADACSRILTTIDQILAERKIILPQDL